MAVIHCGITLVVTVYPILEELFAGEQLLYKRNCNDSDTDNNYYSI